MPYQTKIFIYDAGASPKTIQGIIGHADNRHRYIHSREESMQKAAFEVLSE